MRNAKLSFVGGIAGVASICCYVLAIVIHWPDNQLGTSISLLVASAFPILGFVFCYALCSYTAAERDGAANRLGFVFAAAAFTTLLAMLLVQIAVTSGIGESTRDLDEQTAQALRRGLRLVDFGLDVAWDLLMGTAMIFTGWAIRRRSGLGPGWGFPYAALGAVAIALNAATFPWPPGSHGLFDIGPFAGIFMLALSARLAILGWRAPREAVSSPNPDDPANALSSTLSGV